MNFPTCTHRVRFVQGRLRIGFRAIWEWIVEDITRGIVGVTEAFLKIMAASCGIRARVKSSNKFHRLKPNPAEESNSCKVCLSLFLSSKFPLNGHFPRYSLSKVRAYVIFIDTVRTSQNSKDTSRGGCIRTILKIKIEYKINLKLRREWKGVIKIRIEK